MEWSEVFDKYFIIKDRPEEVLVFIPGSFDSYSIRFAWTTVEAIEAGLDINMLSAIRYYLYGHELEGPSSVFKDWRPMQTPSPQERVCRKVRMMEERWKKFQETKRAPNESLDYSF